MYYEYADWALKTFTNLGDPDPAASARRFVDGDVLSRDRSHGFQHLRPSDDRSRGGQSPIRPPRSSCRNQATTGWVDQDAKDAVMNYARGFQQDSEDQGPDVPTGCSPIHTPGQGPDVQPSSAGSTALTRSVMRDCRDGMLPQDARTAVRMNSQSSHAWGTLLAPTVEVSRLTAKAQACAVPAGTATGCRPSSWSHDSPALVYNRIPDWCAVAPG